MREEIPEIMRPQKDLKGEGHQPKGETGRGTLKEEGAQKGCLQACCSAKHGRKPVSESCKGSQEPGALQLQGPIISKDSTCKLKFYSYAKQVGSKWLKICLGVLFLK